MRGYSRSECGNRVASLSARSVPAAPPWRELLTGRWAISFRAWLLIALLMQWPSYARNSLPIDLSPVWSVAIGILRVFAAGAVLLVADRTYLRRRRIAPAALWVVVATWVAAGVAAMAVQAAAFAYLGEGVINPLRWITSSVTFAMRSALLAYFFGLRDYWSLAVVQLRDSNARLSQLQAQSGMDLAELRARVRRIIAEQVLPHIRRLQQELDAGRSAMTGESLLRISRVADEYSQGVVRQASHRVSALAVDTGNRDDGVAAQHSSVLAGSRPPLVISRRWTGLVFLVTLVPLAFTAPPDDPAVPILVGIAVLVGLLSAGSAIQFRLAGRWGTRTTAWTVCWVASTSILSVGGLAAGGLLPERVTTTVPLVSLMVIVFLLAILGCAMARRLLEVREQAAELEVVQREISAINETLQHELASEKRRVALLLHGPVQGRLAAVSLLLKLEAEQDDSGEITAEAQQRCRSLLDQAEMDLKAVMEGTFDDGVPLQERLDQLITRWQGLAAIELVQDPRATELAMSDPGLGIWMFDIVEEGINNAVTHGHARRIDVRIRATTSEVEVAVSDDGRGCGTVLSPGLGLSTIGRSPARWSLDSSWLGGCHLIVAIPLPLRE